MRDWAAAASRQGSAAAACPPGWAAASPRATAAGHRRRRRTGCCPGRASADGRRRRGRDGRSSGHRARPAKPDGRRPANRDAAAPCWGPADADAWCRRRAAAVRGARHPWYGRPGRRGRRLPARPSAPRHAPRRPPPRCHGRSPAWRPGRAWGPDGRRPAAWAGPKGPVRVPRATWARSAPPLPGRWWDDAAGSVARSSPGDGVQSVRRWARSRRAPERRCRSTPRGHHGAAGPPGPRRCWTRI
jgi:hypothetical protein